MWKRLNESRLRNLGGDGGNRRAYGRDGKLWPRLVLSVVPTFDDQDGKTFRVGCGMKAGPGKWWSDTWIPEELRPELMEMLGEDGDGQS